MPTYCTLEDAYGPEWGKSKNLKPTTPSSQAEQKRVIQYQGPMQNSNETIKQAGKAPRGQEIQLNSAKAQESGLTTLSPTLSQVCPNCNHCLSQNNAFQQKVVDQSIRPLPRWSPQHHDVQAFDPFNRFFAPNAPTGVPQRVMESFGNVDHNFNPYSNPYSNPYREDFGNSGQTLSMSNANNLIQLVLYLLITLFVIQLFELISCLNN